MPNHTDAWIKAEFIYGLLNVSSVTTLAVGGVKRGYAAPNTVTPYVVIRLVPGGSDLMVVGTTRIWHRGLVDVVAVGTRAQADLVDRLAAECDRLLHGTFGPTTSGTVFECTRSNTIFFHEFDEQEFVYSGGEYRIAARAA